MRCLWLELAGDDVQATTSSSSCTFQSRSYGLPGRDTTLTGPESTTRPASSTTTLSAALATFSRCVIMSVVHPSACTASSTFCSTSASSSDVASSSTITSGRVIHARGERDQLALRGGEVLALFLDERVEAGGEHRQQVVRTDVARGLLDVLARTRRAPRTRCSSRPCRGTRTRPAARRRGAGCRC